jgi:hypothetical protein
VKERKPVKFIISQTDEVLVPQSGLALVGALLQDTEIRKRTNALKVEGCLRPEVKHGDVISAAIGLLCLGKTDFNDIEPFRKDGFFRRALGLSKIPSEATLRQRLDAIQDACGPILREESAAMLRKHARKITPCHGEWLPLDIDVSPFDNRGTKKEGVSCTYKLFDGYAPIFGYLGREGYLVHCELREGKQHCQDGTPEFLDATLRYAKQITRAPLLVRLDSGNDAIENLKICRRHKVDYIIKRNLRKESLEDWLEEAQAHGECEEPREGKEVWTGETWKERDGKLYRVIFEVTYRTIAADGQKLLVPEIEANTWWTSLKWSPKEVIAMYHDHGTSEQYHSEIKTDMDLERLPSGKFATNATMLSLALVAYNVLRLCGQGALAGQRRLPADERAPLVKKIFRRRLRSVMQDLMYLAAKLAWHSNRWKLVFWQNSPWGATWRQLYERFCGSRCAGSG